MSTFRIHKSKNYTVMSNHHFQNENLSLRAMGLLSYMLSKPDDWKFSVEGIASKCRDGKDSVRSAVNELIDNGYIVRRSRVRDDSGHLKEAVYDVYESPKENPDFTSETQEIEQKINTKNLPKEQTDHPIAENPPLDKKKENSPMADSPTLVNPALGNPTEENRPLLNTNILNTNILNTNLSINHSSNNKYKIHIGQKNDVIDEMDYNAAIEVVKKQLSPERICTHCNREQVDEIVDLVAWTYITPQAQISISGILTDISLIRKRFAQLDSGHIEYVLDCLNNTTTKIKNRRSYLLTCLFSAPVTIDGYYANQVAHDFASN